MISPTLSTLSAILAYGTLVSSDIISPAVTVCTSLPAKLSTKSQVYLAASANYVTDNEHYFGSSSQAPACVVEVGSDADTAQVIKAIGANRSPFAIISGGHASNQGFSSTQGVLISLVRLKTVTIAADHSSIILGPGNRWATDVYPKTDGSGYNVVGGRVTGPAVGGFTLGGGFSWLTNSYGLACDNVLSYTLVLPNGTISQIGPSQKDLFFALKGGLNRFGIVTSIKFKLVATSPQVWGGYQVFPASSIPALISATSTFSATNTDPKAQIITSLSHTAGIEEGIVLTFYNGPTPPPSLLPFTKIPNALITDVKTRSFSSLAQSSPANTTENQRGSFHTLSTTGYTKNFINAVRNESIYYNSLAAAHGGFFISYDIEPFLKTYGSHATDSAYPHGGSPLPLDVQFGWLTAAEDAFWLGKLQATVDTLTAVAKREGIYNDALTAYPNYALGTYQGSQLYGAANAKRLEAIQKVVDPAGVMGLSGGFVL